MSNYYHAGKMVFSVDGKEIALIEGLDYNIQYTTEAVKPWGESTRAETVRMDQDVSGSISRFHAHKQDLVAVGLTPQHTSDKSFWNFADKLVRITDLTTGDTIETFEDMVITGYSGGHRRGQISRHNLTFEAKRHLGQSESSGGN